MSDLPARPATGKTELGFLELVETSIKILDKQL
jgi:hypothetical protein